MGLSFSISAKTVTLTVERSYDEYGRMTQQRLEEHRNIDYYHNPKGLQTGVGYDDGFRSGFVVDPHSTQTNRLGSITQASLTSSFGAYAATQHYGFDPLGRLTTARLDLNGNIGTYLALDMRYDARGYLSSYTRSDNEFGHAPNGPFSNLPVSYQYDADGQLTRADIGNGSITYQYDASGNLLTRGVGLDNRISLMPITATYNGRNQNLDWAYDSQSRVVRDARHIYRYNDAGRLGSVHRYSADQAGDVVDGALVAHYLYNTSGHRVRAITGDGEIYYLRDADGRILIERRLDSATETITETDYVLHRGQLVMAAERQGDLNPEYTYRFNDRRGNPAVT
jgi:YD repeat-containing protein